MSKDCFSSIAIYSFVDLNTNECYAWYRVRSILFHSFDRQNNRNGEKSKKKKKSKIEKNRTPQQRAHSPQWCFEKSALMWHFVCVCGIRYRKQSIPQTLRSHFENKRFQLNAIRFCLHFIYRHSFTMYDLFMYSLRHWVKYSIFSLASVLRGMRLINRWNGLQWRTCI